MPYRVRKDMVGVPCRVKVTIPFPQRRRRDPSNYIGTVVKAIVDGLVLVGVWPDDTPDWVEVVEPVLRIGGQLTEVLLEER